MANETLDVVTLALIQQRLDEIQNPAVFQPTTYETFVKSSKVNGFKGWVKDKKNCPGEMDKDDIPFFTKIEEKHNIDPRMVTNYREVYMDVRACEIYGNEVKWEKKIQKIVNEMLFRIGGSYISIEYAIMQADIFKCQKINDVNPPLQPSDFRGNQVSIPEEPLAVVCYRANYLDFWGLIVDQIPSEAISTRVYQFLEGGDIQSVDLLGSWIHFKTLNNKSIPVLSLLAIVKTTDLEKAWKKAWYSKICGQCKRLWKRQETSAIMIDESRGRVALYCVNCAQILRQRMGVRSISNDVIRTIGMSQTPGDNDEKTGGNDSEERESQTANSNVSMELTLESNPTF